MANARSCYHDSVHEVVAFDDKPSYKYMQKPGSQVECSKELWDQMSYEQRLNCVKEEMAVIAIERFLAPSYYDPENNKQVPIEKALRIACMKLNTTLSSGWFRRFVVDNGYQAYNDLLSDSYWFKTWLHATFMAGPYANHPVMLKRP